MAETTVNHYPHHHDNKRVSFGTEEQVTKIVYDEVPVDGYDSYVKVTRMTTPFTRKNRTYSPDAPPNKVTVTAEHFEIPRPISPPAQIEDFHPATSPPLPALLKKKMDDNNDNPFRPQEKLFHEVDPIVEAYRNRPYPPSPVGSPTPHDAHANTAVITSHNGRQTTTKLTKVSTDPSGDGQTVVTEVHYSTVSGNETMPLESATKTATKSAAPYITEPDAVLLQSDVPPPGKVELVHIVKKKRCGCCSVQ